MNPGHTLTPDLSKILLNTVLSTLVSQQIFWFRYKNGAQIYYLSCACHS